jgi:hypothetical protein
MFEVRIHGRGGQGVAASADLPALAAFLEGRRVDSVVAAIRDRFGRHRLLGGGRADLHGDGRPRPALRIEMQPETI